MSVVAGEDSRVVAMLSAGRTFELLAEDPNSGLISNPKDSETQAIFQQQVSDTVRNIHSAQLYEQPNGIALKQEELASIVEGHQQSSSPISNRNDEEETKKNDGQSSASVAARNDLYDYCSELISLLRFDGEGLPQYATLDTVSFIQEWLDATPDATYNEVQSVREQLEDQLVASGVALRMELRASQTRDAYEEELRLFVDWLKATRFRTGKYQPLSEPTRYLLSDVAQTESDWSSHYETIMESKADFADRTTMLRILRDGPDDAAHRHKVLHVARRATRLKKQPPEAFSLEKRRQAATLAEKVIEWLDAHRETATDDALAEWIDRMLYLEREGTMAAEVVKAKNELEVYLDYLESCCLHRPHMIESLTPEAREHLVTAVQRERQWLEDNPKANLVTLQTLKRETLLLATEEGLSAVESLSEVQQQSGSGATDTAIVSSSAGAGPTDERGVLPQRAKSTLAVNVDVACTLVQELLSLRIVCRRTAIHNIEVQTFVQKELEEVLAMAKGAAGTSESDPWDFPLSRLLDKYRSALEHCESLGVRVPSSCWTRLD